MGGGTTARDMLYYMLYMFMEHLVPPPEEAQPKQRTAGHLPQALGFLNWTDNVYECPYAQCPAPLSQDSTPH